MQSVEEILDFAIAGEVEAVRFYAELADKSDKAGVKEMLMEFSHEEERHRDKLMNVKAGAENLAGEEKVLDLKVSDYLVEVEPTAGLNYQDALILAMKREKAAYRMYTDLAAKTANADLKDLFLNLAQEEAKHKLYFEVEYDERILQDN